jgi:hypothetical protein
VSDFARELDASYRARLMANRLFRNELFLFVLRAAGSSGVTEGNIAALFARRKRVIEPGRSRPPTSTLSATSWRHCSTSWARMALASSGCGRERNHVLGAGRKRCTLY